MVSLGNHENEAGSQVEYDMHHGDLPVPLKLTLGHRPDCFSQALPFSDVDIAAPRRATLGEEELARAFKVSPTDEASL